MDRIGLFSFILLLLWVLGFGLWRTLRGKRQRKEFARIQLLKAFKEGISLNPKDYQISKKAKRRKNGVERRFRGRYITDLYEVFGGACARCGQKQGKLELDHFFIPKSRGGNLMMRHRDGYWVSNCLLLCRRCNSNKADKSVDDYFSVEEIEKIKLLQIKMTKIINA